MAWTCGRFCVARVANIHPTEPNPQGIERRSRRTLGEGEQNLALKGQLAQVGACILNIYVV